MIAESFQSLTQQDIEAMLPHAGNMSLLDGIISCSDNTLMAVSQSHLATDNPLAVNGRVAMINGIEYAAQATAVHGYLLSGEKKPGYIASVRNVEMSASCLPQEEKLFIRVERLMADEQGFSYQFQISEQAGESASALISGRITVFLSVK